jgi:hypothetical protein
MNKYVTAHKVFDFEHFFIFLVPECLQCKGFGIGTLVEKANMRESGISF